VLEQVPEPLDERGVVIAFGSGWEIASLHSPWHELRADGNGSQVSPAIAFLLDEVPHGIADACLEPQVKRSMPSLIVV